MPNRITIRSLRRAHCVLRTSFLSYLDHARPYAGPGDGSAKELLDEMIARQRGLADRVAELVRDLGGEPDVCDFPASFTDAHDLSIRYVLRRAAEGYRGDVARLVELRDEQCDPVAEELFESVIEEAEAIGGCLKKAASPQPATTA